MLIQLQVFLVLFFALAVGFFSGSETGMVSLNRIKLRHLVEARLKVALKLEKLLNEPNRFLGTCLIGTNLSVIIATTLATNLAIGFLGEGQGRLASIIMVSPLVLIFGEIIPKSLFRQKANRAMLEVGSLLDAISRIISPLIWFLGFITNAILRLLGQHKKAAKRSVFVTREELRYLIREGEKEGVIESREGSVIYSIFDFGVNKVTKAMNSIKRLVTMKPSQTIADLKRLSLRTNVTRFPVLGDAGKFIGLVNINDCLYEEDDSRSIKEFLRPMSLIPMDTVSDRALLKLRRENQHFAMVVDETQKPIGYVTIEDLIEELVGDI